MTTLLLPLILLSQPALELPWPCGTTVRTTQGHNTGSHTKFGSWAWDFGIPEGGPVHAAAPGVVRRLRMDSTRGGCDRSYAGDANYVVIDHEDGTSALYLHLRAGSSPLQIGQRVNTSDFIAEVGLTGWVCGAHLHFQIQSLCDSWWCPSMPAGFDRHGDPTYPERLSSPCETCLADLDGTGPTVVSESDAACFLRRTDSWWDVAEGHDGHHFYTFAIDADRDETLGTWTWSISQPGLYSVDVFVPQTEATSQQARYRLYHADGMAEHVVNQSTDKGWRHLGEYRLDEGPMQRLVLGDNTGEHYSSLMRKLAFDAVRFTPVGAMPPDAGVAMDARVPDVGAPVVDAGPSPDATAALDAGPAPPPPPVDAGVAPDAQVGPPDGTIEGGCRCVSNRDSVATSVGWLGLGLLGWSARRRRRRDYRGDSNSRASSRL